MTRDQSRLQTISKIVNVLREAHAAALKADPGEHADGGTCNFDTPAFRVARLHESSIQQAAKLAGVLITPFKWSGARRWYWLNLPIFGQGNRRSAMMEAAQSVLNRPNDIPGWVARGYRQMD